ncbi:hypothetical protein NDU88_000691 [Pleurodeles waltl]|uniref:Uncharacterized protein n=1 Tax=Pleurodeles waltl TaxID=8319 RepID=A0AAV7THX3_PLEWA|nr:hypothetical protein NDU88_000691 [Pleurodeles waltl]
MMPEHFNPPKKRKERRHCDRRSEKRSPQKRRPRRRRRKPEHRSLASEVTLRRQQVAEAGHALGRAWTNQDLRSDHHADSQELIGSGVKRSQSIAQPAGLR